MRKFALFCLISLLEIVVCFLVYVPWEFFRLLWACINCFLEERRQRKEWEWEREHPFLNNHERLWWMDQRRKAIQWRRALRQAGQLHDYRRPWG